MVSINAIVAMDLSGGIGVNNTLPWPKNSEDLKFFKSMTENSIVVMGYHTWLSLPSKLPNRINVVISREEVDGADYTIEDTNDSAFYFLDEIRRIAMSNPLYREVFIMGGKKTYERLLPIVDKWYITQIEESYECDTYLRKNLLTNDFSVVTYNQLNDISTVEIYRRTKNKL